MADRSPMQVELNTKNCPVSFVWRDRKYHVNSIQECWRLMGAWWLDQGEQTFFRVMVDNGGVYELLFDHASAMWRMHSVCD